MSEKIYRTLQKKLDDYSIGFPESKSGIELKILQKLFCKEDAEVFISLSPILDTPEAIAEKLGKPVGGVAEHLENMANKGLLFRLHKGDVSKYGTTPFIHGLYEFQVSNIDKDLAEMVEKYYQDGLQDTIIESAGDFLRTIPIMESLETEHHIASFDDAQKILEKANPIIVADCICRKQKDLVDKSCNSPLEVCFLFGSMAKFYIDNKMGRQITSDEALVILKEAQEAGLVTQPATAQNPSGMCNCCGDCCGILHSIKLHPKPAEIVFSNHFAAVETDECIGCELCIERCHMDAITLNDDESSVIINKDRCIGCGVCIPVCSSDAIKLNQKAEDKLLTPPLNSAEQMITMAKNRGILK